ncbi:MAG TPA: response regulator [Nitrospira sp.]|jgi:DNA-binding NarL/FixJ family response regulator|nr:response regulator [Nitrospira sp.]
MASTIQTISVLIADDREEFQQLAAACLESDPHIKILGFWGTGEAVIEQTVRWRFDLVVLDMWLSDMDGLTALRHIKRLPSAPRVIMAHLYDDPVCRLAAQKSGADGFVLKADYPIALLQAVHELFPMGGVDRGGRKGFHHETDTSLIGR